MSVPHRNAVQPNTIGGRPRNVTVLHIQTLYLVDLWATSWSLSIGGSSSSGGGGGEAVTVEAQQSGQHLSC